MTTSLIKNLTLFISSILFIYSCERLDVTANSSIKQKDEVISELNGLWVGKINGGEPYFNQNPRITLDLIQSNSLILGNIRSSDGAFKNATIQNGEIAKPAITFKAKQTDYYTGSLILFSGFIEEDTVKGIWQSSQSDSGKWYIIRQ
jgi:hypothetical protein